jgi:hypothetical protein
MGKNSGRLELADWLALNMDQGPADQRISGGWCYSRGPRRSRGQTKARATGVSRAFACVLNTRGCPQVFCTAPVIHPVRVHKYPWQTS